VLDVLFVKDDTLEHIIERLVVLLQVNVVVYIHLNERPVARCPLPRHLSSV
jgi:hypothetical protein